jgi:hypothetical protein
MSTERKPRPHRDDDELLKPPRDIESDKPGRRPEIDEDDDYDDEDLDEGNDDDQDEEDDAARPRRR